MIQYHTKLCLQIEFSEGIPFQKNIRFKICFSLDFKLKPLVKEREEKEKYKQMIVR